MRDRKCVVCGCTDSHACEEGCEWVSLAPPVCSCCVAKVMIARLWAFVFAVEGAAAGALAREIRQTRTVYSFLSNDRSRDLGIPTLRQVTQINRNVGRWEKQHAAAKPATKKGGPRR